MSRNRLAARDRVLLFGLALGLIFGVAIGRKIYSPFLVLVLVTLVFVGAYGALRFSRRARDATASSAGEEVSGPEASPDSSIYSFR